MFTRLLCGGSLSGMYDLSRGIILVRLRQICLEFRFRILVAYLLVQRNRTPIINNAAKIFLFVLSIFKLLAISENFSFALSIVAPARLIAWY